MNAPAATMPDSRKAKRYRIVLITPSQYDDDGYVIRWWRSTMPSNSLASVYGLVMGSIQRGVLADYAQIDVTPIDETNTRVRVNDIIEEFRADGTVGFVGLVGVQSTQYPRALDIARPLRTAGIPVV